MTNLRQWQAACVTYTNDNKDYVVKSYAGSQNLWFMVLLHQGYIKGVLNETGAEKKQVGIGACQINTRWHTGGWSVNYMVNSNIWAFSSAPYFRSGDVLQSSAKISILDGLYRSIHAVDRCDYVYFTSKQAETFWFDGPHGRFVNAVFWDGHTTVVDYESASSLDAY